MPIYYRFKSDQWAEKSFDIRGDSMNVFEVKRTIAKRELDAGNYDLVLTEAGADGGGAREFSNSDNILDNMHVVVQRIASSTQVFFFDEEPVAEPTPSIMATLPENEADRMAQIREAAVERWGVVQGPHGSRFSSTTGRRVQKCSRCKKLGHTAQHCPMSKDNMDVATGTKPVESMPAIKPVGVPAMFMADGSIRPDETAFERGMGLVERRGTDQKGAAGLAPTADRRYLNRLRQMKSDGMTADKQVLYERYYGREDPEGMAFSFLRNVNV